MAGSKFLRQVGHRTVHVTEIEVMRIKKYTKRPGGRKLQPEIVPPFLPKSACELYHPGGNSLCYMVTTAHLMGADPIWAAGFTLANGGSYFFGGSNPVTRQKTIYDTDRAIDWLKWYESVYPNRVRLVPGWSGPVYEVFRTEMPGGPVNDDGR